MEFHDLEYVRAAAYIGGIIGLFKGATSIDNNPNGTVT